MCVMDKSSEKVDGKLQDQAAENEGIKKNPAHKLDQVDGEIGGPAGLEPTRYGDWERKGIVSDF